MKTKNAFISSLVFRVNILIAKNGNSFVNNFSYLFIAQSFLSVVFLFISLDIASYLLLSTFATFAILAIVEEIYKSKYHNGKLKDFFYQSF